MIGSDLKIALDKLQAGRYGGLLLQDYQPTGVTIEFGEQNFMEIRGLGPDLPPFIRLGTAKGTEISEDGITWEPVQAEYGFDVYRLLDPRIYANRVKYYKEREEKGVTYVEGEYGVEALGLTLPREMNDWMREHKATWRLIQFAMRKGLIVEFTQDDFPPSRHKITVRIVPC